jgi:hypothetical protein
VSAGEEQIREVEAGSRLVSPLRVALGVAAFTDPALRVKPTATTEAT